MSFFFTQMESLALNWNSTYQMEVKMSIDKKTEKAGKEKEWENPQAPENTSDERDREQIARLYKEAKRRHDNLSENQENENKEDNKQQ
ncbi:hypothetical protein [Mucilaginibacter sp.]|uniref:hypothetical protein n=1 Tax=Mucilaginibacter sp. TaxID=1882438 RepID=UPI00262C99B7|nr:hypothetical protein [Mucilaginibacter sp.]MDB5127313.1 hypothetical protein [Mucilaginibacter sp.]